MSVDKERHTKKVHIFILRNLLKENWNLANLTIKLSLQVHLMNQWTINSNLYEIVQRLLLTTSSWLLCSTTRTMMSYMGMEF